MVRSECSRGGNYRFFFFSKTSLDQNVLKHTLRIGAIMPLSGDLAAYGKPVKEGMELLLTEINETGGVGGKKLEILFEDDADKSIQAVNAFNKLVDTDKVPMILGPLTSGAPLATAPVAEIQRFQQLDGADARAAGHSRHSPTGYLRLAGGYATGVLGTGRCFRRVRVSRSVSAFHQSLWPGVARDSGG